MKRHFLFFWVFIGCLLQPFEALLQEAPKPKWLPEMAWSDAHKVGRRDRNPSFAAADSQHVYLLINKPVKNAQQLIEVYDRTTMKRLQEQPLVLPDIPEHTVQFDRLLLFNGALLGMVTGFDKTSDQLRAFAFRILPEGSNGPPIFLGERPARNRKSSPFAYSVSSDGQFLLVHPAPGNEQPMNERFSFRVLDSKLEVHWQKDLELPEASGVREVSEYRVDQRGHVHLLSGVSSPQKGRRSDRASSGTSYSVISYDPFANSVKEFEVALEGKWVVASSFDLAANDDLVIGGFYSNDRYHSMAGTFFFRIDAASRSVAASGLQAFSDDFLERFMKARKVERGDELEHYYFDHFIVRPDGGASFVAEQYYMRQDFRTDLTTGRQEIIYYYHYNDLIVVDVNAEGSINWTVRVPKRQLSINDQGTYSSYALGTKGHELFLVFNDEESNLGVVDGEVRSMSNARRSTATLVHINAEGQVDRVPLFSSRGLDSILRPKVHFRSDDGELLLYARFRKSYRVVRLEF